MNFVEGVSLPRVRVMNAFIEQEFPSAVAERIDLDSTERNYSPVAAVGHIRKLAGSLPVHSTADHRNLLERRRIHHHIQVEEGDNHQLAVAAEDWGWPATTRVDAMEEYWIRLQ